MSLRRVLAAALVAVGLSLSLSGCLEFGQVAAKTDAIHEKLKDLPGVIDSHVEVTENSAFSARRSAVYLNLASDVTADQVVAMITTFAHANLETGIEPVSGALYLVNETATFRNEVQVQYAQLTDATAAALGETWVDLLGSTDGASIAVATSTEGYAIDLNVALGGEPTIDRDLEALAAAGKLFDRLGPIARYNQADGRFAATGSLPGADAIAQLSSLQAAAVAAGGDIGGEFGFGHNSLKVTIPVAAAPVDATTGLATTLLTVVDSIPSGAFPVLFTVNDEVESIDGVTGITFTNIDCGAYANLVDPGPSRALATYWGSDGRTLLDGAPGASCFS